VRHILASGGEISALMRSIDWAQTPLGLVESWPQSLRISVGICLHSHFPILICWGPELVMLYNDACLPLLGATRHSQALGRAAREVWPEMWPTLGPLLEQVLAVGEAAWLDDQALLLDRNGYPEERYATFSCSPIHDQAGQVGGIFCVVTDTTERVLGERRAKTRQQAEKRLHRLQELTARFAATQSLDEVRRIILSQVLSALGADGGGLRYITAQELVVEEQDLGLHMSAETVYRFRSIPLLARHPAADAARDGQAVFLRDSREIIERYPDLAETVVQQRTQAIAHLPLKRGEEVFGVLSLNFATPRSWDAAEQTFALALADRAAIAYERARLFEAEQQIRKTAEQAAERLTRLQHITAALGAALAKEQVADTIVQEVKGAMNAPAAIVFLLSQEGAVLEQLTSAGYREETTAPWLRIPISTPVPITDCVTNGESLFVESPEEYAARYPHRADVAEREGIAAFIAAPLKLESRVVGALGVTFTAPRIFSVEDRAFIESVAWQCAQALERARLYDAERRARAELLERERHLHLALESARMVAWTWDPVRNHIETTENFAAIYGLAAIEYAEQGFALVHPDDLERHQRTVLQAVATQSPYHSEFGIIRPDTGQIVWLDERAVPVLDATGQLQALAGVVVDITERKRAEEALRKSEAGHRQLANAMPQLVWTSDSEGVVDYYNSRVDEYAGIVHTGEESWDWQPVLHADDLQPTLAAWREATRSGQIYTFEHRIQMKDGSFRWHLSRAMPAHDLNGQIVKWFGTATDIHEQHQAAQDAHCLADIGEIIRLTADVDTMLSQVTQALGEYLQLRRCMVIEIDLAHDLGVIRQQYCRGVPPAAREYRLTQYSQAAQLEIDAGRTLVNVDSQSDPRTAAIYEVTYRPYGERAYVAVPLMRDGIRKGTLWVSDDVARHWQAREVVLLETVAERVWLAIEKLRAEQALRANEERLQMLYEREQRARAQAEAASRLKDEFLATVSHELRTPLTSILGYGQLIQNRSHDPAYVARTIEKVVRSAKAQAQLIDDLLDVARIVTGKLRIEPRPIAMGAVIQAAIETLRPAIDAKGLRLEIDLNAEASVIVGDPNRLQQVVWNLVSNAVKFTPSGGSVRVGFEMRDGEALLTVGDTGQGIGAEFLPYVFDRFRQAESTSTRTHSGLGLGLAIVRHLVEMHGGTVQVESLGEGQGASFIVRLPLSAGEPTVLHSAPDEQERPELCPPALEGLRVLVVDDQLDIVELLHDLLMPCGAVIRTATAARDALATLRAWQPDVLVSDIAMPGQDGYWLIRKVRALAPEDGGGIPALALTAYVRVEDRLRVLSAGFQLYVPKPVDPAELLDAVARLATTRAGDEL
jgi:PAS domain S-box-containing protein